MIYSNSAALPREELGAVMVQGNGINKQNIWASILPGFGVSKRNGHLVNMTIASAEMLRIMDKIVEPGGDIDRIQLTFGDQTYSIALRKEEVQIPDEVEKDYADYFSTEAVASQAGSDKLELTQEYLTANAIMSTATFGAATNSAVAYTGANLATISFIADVYAAIERVRDKGEEPNTIIIPTNVYMRLRQATLVLGFVRGTLMASVEIDTNTIQKAFSDEGIEKVLIGRSRYNTSEAGATPSLSKVWPNTYIWVGRTSDTMSANEGGIDTIQGVGSTLYWEPYGMHIVETYRDEPRESNIVRAKSSAVPYIANANAGTLIATQYA